MSGLTERLVPDELWELFRRVVPQTVVTRPQGGGRRRTGDREVLAAIVYVSVTGCTWRELPTVFGPAWPTVYRRFAEWRRGRVWARLHHVILAERTPGDQWEWSRQAIDAVGVRTSRRTP
ncbi:transposase [Streptomyces sp. SL13]|uniref:Transposase n=1 Tax=Streptantibioticus silvisoli TaxID=2705255 RepID=A0AA90H4C3_9ACTN|nr:transposase [Streptantibioticus silvisoli]MDI5964457.1 transposase [Streptantibioticus silvisoli]MDI5970748.1 transposase [Streptantibioticus silvisoli]